MSAMPDFISRTPGPCILPSAMWQGMLAKRSQRIDGIEVTEQQNGFRLVASGEIDLDAVGVVFGVVDTRAAAHGFEAAGEERAHAVGGGLVVAGRFDLDELADGLDNLLLAGFEIAEAFGPDRVGLERLRAGSFGACSFLGRHHSSVCRRAWLRAFSEFLAPPAIQEALTAESRKACRARREKRGRNSGAASLPCPTER